MNSRRDRLVLAVPLLAVLVFAAVAAACGDDEDGEATPTSAPPAATATQVAPAQTPTEAEPTAEVTQAPETAAVDIEDFQFSPETVTIRVGGTVAWTNTGTTHNVIGEDFASENLGSGETFSHTFDAAGEFNYVCTIHPGMRGTVVVVE